MEKLTDISQLKQGDKFYLITGEEEMFGMNLCVFILKVNIIL